ncbi:hypothetical protein STEG23_038044 [Scotinomys teguina]
MLTLVARSTKALRELLEAVPLADSSRYLYRNTGYAYTFWTYIMSFAIFKFIYMVYYIDGLSYVDPSLHLWDKVYLVMVDNVFDVVLELVCQYFIEYLCIYVHEGDCLDKDLSILLIFSKNQLFVSLILCIVFFVSILLISALNLIISLHLFLLGDFASSISRAFSFDLVDLSIGWNPPSSAFCRLGLFMVSQISWIFCVMAFLDLVFSLTVEVTGCSWVLGNDSSSKGDWLLLHLKK